MKGFTLIELLTVVVIVGVLTAIALPQYQKAVEKSRASEAMTIARSILDAQQRSLSAFPGDPVNTKRALDIQLSGGSWSTDSVYTTEQFTYTLANTGVRATRIGGDGYTLSFALSGTNACFGGTICPSLEGMGFYSKKTLLDGITLGKFSEFTKGDLVPVDVKAEFTKGGTKFSSDKGLVAYP